jgi:hypothetical protein
MRTVRAMQYRKHLTILGQRTEQRIVIALAFLLAIETGGCSFGIMVILLYLVLCKERGN